MEESEREGEGPSSEAEEAPAEPGDSDQQPEAEETAKPQVPEFTEADESELDTEVHMEAGRLKALGDAFAQGRANAVAFGELVTRVARAVQELAKAEVRQPGDWIAPLEMRAPRFASAEVVFIVGENESIRMDRESPTRDASRKLSGLLGAQGDELLEMAVSSGADSTKAFKNVLEIIRDRDLEVAWTDPDSQVVEISGPQAATNLAVLQREGEPELDEIEIFGHLEMADAGKNMFRLKLPQGQKRPPELKHKRKIPGTYAEAVGERVKAQNLWDSDVLARVRIVREREGTTASPRDARFELVSVEPAVAPPSQTQRGHQPDGQQQL